MPQPTQTLAAQADAAAKACSDKAWALLGSSNPPDIWPIYQAEISGVGLSVAQRALAVLLLLEKLGAEGSARLFAMPDDDARAAALHWAKISTSCAANFGASEGFGPKMFILGAMREIARAAGDESGLASAMASGADNLAKRMADVFEALAAKLSTSASPTAGDRGVAHEHKMTVIGEFTKMSQSNEFKSDWISASVHVPIDAAWMGFYSNLSELIRNSSGSEQESESNLASFRAMISDGGLASPILAWAAARNFFEVAVKYARDGLWGEALSAVESMPATDRQLTFDEQAKSFANAAELWRRTLVNAESSGGALGRAERLRELQRHLQHKGVLMSGEGTGPVIPTQIRPLGDKSFERSICWLAWPQGFAQALREFPKGLQPEHVEWTRRIHGVILDAIGEKGHAKLADSAGAVLEALDLELAAPSCSTNKRSRHSL